MKSSLNPWLWLGGLVLMASLVVDPSPVLAQDIAGGKPAAAQHRPLAPGVLRKVDPDVAADETVSRQDLNALIKSDPTLKDISANVAFRRDIWYLEFQYKSLRLIDLDLLKGSALKRKPVWYLVYSVTNPSKALHPVEVKEGPNKGTFKIETIATTACKFIPRFTLEIPKLNKSYEDQDIPIAMDPIRIREDSTRRFYSSVDMSIGKIKPGETRWGIATWEAAKWEGRPPADSEGVDPRIDRFSIYVGGLTNAYKWTEDPEKVSPDRVGSGRQMTHKVLKLNFWRIGDPFELKESQIRLGWEDMPEYSWVYR
jgi:hypothetical protein